MGTDLAAPGVGTNLAAPGVGTDLAAAGMGTDLATPSVGTDLATYTASSAAGREPGLPNDLPDWLSGSNKQWVATDAAEGMESRCRAGSLVRGSWRRGAGVAGTVVAGPH